MPEEIKRFYLGDDIFPELTIGGEILRGKITSLDMEGKSFVLGNTTYRVGEVDQQVSIKTDLKIFSNKDKEGFYLQVVYNKDGAQTQVPEQITSPQVYLLDQRVSIPKTNGGRAEGILEMIVRNDNGEITVKIDGIKYFQYELTPELNIGGPNNSMLSVKPKND